MAIRFRKCIKLAPGIRMNLSGSGASWTFGPQGMSVGVGRRGSHLNAGIPGSGLFTRTRLAPATQRAAPPPPSGKTVAIAVSINDDGVLAFKDSQGNPISEAQIEAAKKQGGEQIKALIQGKCDELNNQVDALGRIC